MSSNNTEAIMTVKEAADYLRLADSTVYRLLIEGRMPGRKVGGKWRISRSGLEEWLQGPEMIDDRRPHSESQ